MPHRVAPDSEFEDLLSVLTTLSSEEIEESMLFDDGDHWQDSRAWIGPMPIENHKEYDLLREEIRKGFVSGNKVKEVIDRHLDGILSITPDWQLVPLQDPGLVPEIDEETGEETGEMVPAPLASSLQSLIDEAQALLINWWDDREVSKAFRKIARNLLKSGRICGRLYIPAGLLLEGMKLPPGEMAQMMELIYLDTPDYDHATIYTDDQTKLDLAICHWEELQDDEQTEDRLELVFINGVGETVIRVVAPPEREGEVYKLIGESTINLGGRLTIFEIDRELFITPQIKQNQKLFNLALSMMQRNVIIGGFLERVITNAQIPGHFEADPDSPDGKKFVPDPLALGTAQTMMLAGLPIRDENGRVTGYTSPTVNYRDPVDITSFKGTKAEARENILSEAKQLHVEITGDATASGKSRIQAMSDFEKSLTSTKDALDALGHWLIETVLWMAGSLSGKQEAFKELRVVFNCMVDTGPVDPSEQTSVVGIFNAGIRSHRTTLIKLGDDDPDAELEQIKREKMDNVNMAREMGLDPGFEGEEEEEEEEEGTEEV